VTSPASKTRTGKGAERRHYRQLWQGGMLVATVEGPTRAFAEREIAHYALMYGQDGPVEIRNPDAQRRKEKPRVR
jgi:hypothetical protein